MSYFPAISKSRCFVEKGAGVRGDLSTLESRTWEGGKLERQIDAEGTWFDSAVCPVKFQVAPGKTFSDAVQGYTIPGQRICQVVVMHASSPGSEAARCTGRFLSSSTCFDG